MKLHDDETRCHDSKCLLREECERWLQRCTPGDDVRHATSLNLPKGLAGCLHRIPPGPTKVWFKEGHGHD